MTVESAVEVVEVLDDGIEVDDAEADEDFSITEEMEKEESKISAANEVNL